MLQVLPEVFVSESTAQGEAAKESPRGFSTSPAVDGWGGLPGFIFRFPIFPEMFCPVWAYNHAGCFTTI